jgi:hypothetical protein
MRRPPTHSDSRSAANSLRAAPRGFSRSGRPWRRRQVRSRTSAFW